MALGMAWPRISTRRSLRAGSGRKLTPDGWNFHSHVEPVLHFLKALLRELVTLPGHRWTKKSRGSLVTQRLAGPLHADQRHSEGRGGDRAGKRVDKGAGRGWAGLGGFEEVVWDCVGGDGKGNAVALEGFAEVLEVGPDGVAGADAAATLRLEWSSRVRRKVCFSEAVHHGWMNLSCWKSLPKRARRNRL